MLMGCSSHINNDESFENTLDVESATQQERAPLTQPNYPCRVVVDSNYEDKMYSEFYAQYISYMEDRITETDYYNYLTLCMNTDKDNIAWLHSFLESCEINATKLNRTAFEEIKEDCSYEKIYTLILPYLSDYSTKCIEIVAKMIESAAKKNYQSLSYVDIQLFENNSKEKQYLQVLDLYFKIIQYNQIPQEILYNSQSTETDCYDEFEESLDEIGVDVVMNAVSIGVGLASITLGSMGTATIVGIIGSAIGASYTSYKICKDIIKAYKRLSDCLEDVTAAYWDESYLKNTENKEKKLNGIIQHIDNIIFQNNIIA